MTIREALRALLHNEFEDILRIGTVVPGSQSGNFCQVIPFDTEGWVSNNDDNVNTPGVPLQNVRLQAGSSSGNLSNGILLVPADSSIVVVAEINPNDYCIVLYSGIKSIQFLDGTLGGLVEVMNLVTKLNNLETLLNGLIALYNAHVHTANNTPTVSLETTTLTPTVRADIENTKITHGNP